MVDSVLNTHPTYLRSRTDSVQCHEVFRLDDRGGRSWVSLSPHVCKVVYLCFFFLFFFNV